MTDRIKALEDALRTKAAMIELGEKIAWGSDVALMREAADALAASQPAPDCHQPDFVTADTQPVLAKVKVKPLVWKEKGWGEYAEAMQFMYLLCAPNSSDECNGWYVLEETTNTVIQSDGSKASAKGTAQADYEARIKAALEVQPLTVQDAARVLLISSDRGVCVGGRWDGWLMIRHPDGHWVSHHKLDAVDPRTEMTDALRAIAEGRA